MKRMLSLILIACMMLALVACGSSQSSAPAETQPKDTRFRVGYARANITPSSPVGLTCYGNTSERIHKTVLDYLYLTCVAITDAEDNTIILMSIDLTGMANVAANSVRAEVSDATGVPKENITISGTHTHSGPDFGSVSTHVNKIVGDLALEAIADQSYADMYIGDSNTVNLNFVRHYVMDDGSVVGDNHGDPTGKEYTGHVSEADSQLQLIQFKREDGKKDVIMANWQAHASITGGSTKYDMSADFVGAFRDCMEKELDCQFVYYQGAAGNLNATSRIGGECANTTNPKNYRVHGELLTGHAKEALADMTLLDPGLIKVHTEDYIAECQHADGELVNYASLVIAYYQQGHTAAETQIYAMQYGIASYYHAVAISNRGGLGATDNIPITTIQMGNVGLATIPGELFDTCGMYIKENSPYDMTFVMGYCNGAVSYLPTAEAYEYGCYEADIGKFVPGTAEALAERHVELLNELSGK